VYLETEENVPEERYIALTKKQLLHDTKSPDVTYLLIKLDNETSYGRCT